MQKYHFIHIPKTGGSTIKKNTEINKIAVQSGKSYIDKEYLIDLQADAIKNERSPQIGHCRWKDLDKSYRSKFSAVAIVRNPWSKLVSQFLFAHKIYNEHKNKITISKPVDVFEDFLELRHEKKHTV